VLDDVVADLPSKVGACLVRAEEVEADKDAGLVDVFDDVPEVVVGVCGAGGAAVECDGDVVGAEEGVEGLDDGGAVAGVR